MAHMIPLGASGRYGERAPQAFAAVDDEDAEFAKSRHWWATGRGYAACEVGYLHRLILGLRKGDGKDVDHINRNPLDCRRANLRVVTHAQNMQNAVRRPGKSGVPGVVWHGPNGKWNARLVHGQKIVLNAYFDDLNEAAEAYREARAKHMPYSPQARAAVLSTPLSQSGLNGANNQKGAQ